LSEYKHLSEILLLHILITPFWLGARSDLETYDCSGIR